MRPIPKKLREEMASDPYYEKCCRANDECAGRITWEHAFIYGGRQINEKWAIIPLCVYHHLGAGLVKIINQKIASTRASRKDREKYPLLNWEYLDKYVIEEKRTGQQNKAMHLYFSMVAEALNDAGLDVKSVLEKQMEIPFTMLLVKELIWKRAQKSYLKKDSTTELKKQKDIDAVYDIVNRYLSQFGVHIPFPDKEERALEQAYGPKLSTNPGNRKSDKIKRP